MPAVTGGPAASTTTASRSTRLAGRRRRHPRRAWHSRCPAVRSLDGRDDGRRRRGGSPGSLFEPWCSRIHPSTSRRWMPTSRRAGMLADLASVACARRRCAARPEPRIVHPEWDRLETDPWADAKAAVDTDRRRSPRPVRRLRLARRLRTARPSRPPRHRRPGTRRDGHRCRGERGGQACGQPVAVVQHPRRRPLRPPRPAGRRRWRRFRSYLLQQGRTRNPF